MTAEHSKSAKALIRPGAALKALRLKKGWSLAEVSRRSGLPTSSLSKVENDKMELTLDKLLRVSSALDTDMAHLFTVASSPSESSEPSGRRSITRAGEGKLLESPIGHYRYLAYELLNKQTIPMVIEVTARSLEEFGEFNRHPGEELVFVLEGELDLYTTSYLPVSLKKGDSLYFDSNMGHAYIALGEHPCRILSVCVAPAAELLKLMETKPQVKEKAETARHAAESTSPQAPRRQRRERSR
jgi:transcriptional regulator with XRE-family HTH domain